jgi:hypothetical protein
VAVPEATSNLDNASSAGKNNVRPSGQFSTMQPIPITEGVQETSNYEFWLGVLATNRG